VTQTQLAGSNTVIAASNAVVPRQRAESGAIFAAIAAFAVTAVVIGIWMWGQRLPLSGEGIDSFGTRAAWVAGVCAGAAFAVAFVIATRRGMGAWRLRMPLAKRILDAVVLTVAIAVVSGLGVEAVSSVFQRGFMGMTVDAFGGAALAGAAAAYLAYTATLFGTRVVTTSVAQLAVLVLFIGTVASMLTAPDEHWWEFHFSALGNQAGSGSAVAFNGALILTGLIITVFANYASRDARQGMLLNGVVESGIPESDVSESTAGDGPRSAPFWTLERRASTMAWGFAVIGLCMMVVGLVHDAVNTPVHIGAASGMVVAFALLAVFALTKLPGFPSSFKVFTLVVMAGIVVSIVLWIPLGYYALTGVEFISAGLLFSWFIVFARTVSNYAQRDV
jgi:hypothetical membrane protein